MARSEENSNRGPDRYDLMFAEEDEMEVGSQTKIFTVNRLGLPIEPRRRGRE